MAFPVVIYGKPGDEKKVTTTKHRKLGTKMEFADGRVFRWSLAKGAIGAGKLAMQVDFTHAAHDEDLAVAVAAAVGAGTIVFTNVSASIGISDFADGWVHVNDADGEGQIFLIKDNNEVGTTDVGTLTLEEDDGISEALTTSSKIGITRNTYLDVELYDGNDIDGVPVGVASTEIADSEYFWVQTAGFCAVLANGTLIKGKAVTPGQSVDGSVDVYTVNTSAGGLVDNAVIGHVSRAATATGYALIDLKIGW